MHQAVQLHNHVVGNTRREASIRSLFRLWYPWLLRFELRSEGWAGQYTAGIGPGFTRTRRYRP